LQQVLINLITNAIDAMSVVKDRGKLLKVRSELSGPAEIRISVEDSGAGIDVGHMPKIFDAFFTTKPHGMGMGLSICRSIIESHGGQLWVEPGNPYGATFFIALPCRVPVGEGRSSDQHPAAC
jgi:signal transduction histidine kinase